MNLTIEAFEQENAFDNLREDWKDLLARSRHHIFMTPEWQSNWWAAYRPGKLWIVTVRQADGQLVGLFPWFIHDMQKWGRTVRWVGCVEVTDYLQPLIAEGLDVPVLQALAEFLKANKEHYDVLDLCNIPLGDRFLEDFPAVLEKSGFAVSISQQEVCPVIKLPETFEEYLSNQLDKKQRHEIRRKLRRADGHDVDIRWYYVDPQKDNVSEAGERFLRLMRASSPQKAEFLNDPENVDFFNRVLPVLANCGWLRLSFIEINGQDAAAYFAFDYHNSILLYNSGIDPRVKPELSPGIVLLTYMIKDAIEQGKTAFDFLRGDEDYKYRMGGVDTPVMMLHAALA